MSRPVGGTSDTLAPPSPPGRRLVLLGCGAMGHAVYDSLYGAYPALRQAFSAVLAVDQRTPAFVTEFVSTGGLPPNFTFERVKIAPDNVQHLFDTVLGVTAGDVVLDLLVNVDPVPLLEACMQRGAHYLNATTDAWLSAGPELVARKQSKLIALQDKHNGQAGGAPTCLLEQGMNPGLVSYAALRALAQAAEASGVAWPRPEQFTRPDGAIDKKAMLSARAEVARRLGLTSIHSTDVDYHLSRTYQHSNKVLASTWSSTKFWEECVMPAEFHAGTVGVFEAAAVASSSTGSDAAATLSPAFDSSHGITASTPGRQAFDAWTKSYSGPEGYYRGMLVPHGENSTLGRSLTVWAADGKTPVWSPEVAFIYRPSNPMLESCFLHGCDDSVQLGDITPHLLCTERDQLEGQESVGVLLRFDAAAGACNEPALRHAVHNATILQVAAGVLAGVGYILAHPREGICWPEEAAHTERILDQALALLGRVDIMHGCEALTSMPKLLTSPGAMVQLDLQTELQRAVAAVRGSNPPACVKASAEVSRADTETHSCDQRTAVEA